MTRAAPARILQIGYGAFGETHLRAWLALGMADRLIIAEPRPEARVAAAGLSPVTTAVADYRKVLDEAEIVVIVTPTDTHHAVAADVLDAGKPVLIEKPIARNTAEAEDLAARARRTGALVRGGYYFRHHPKTIWLRSQVQAGRLGDIWLLNGRFLGFKRTRADAGALLNDAVHFLDLFVWLLGETPERLYAVTRDHFARGLEDFALLVLQFPGGAVAQIETGYIQPGRRPDAVVQGALTSKEITVSGSAGTVEIDYAGETIRWHRLHHVRTDGQWHPQVTAEPPPAVGGAGPVEVVTAELAAFLADIAAGGPAAGDHLDGGVTVARLLDAALLSARDRNAVVMPATT